MCNSVLFCDLQRPLTVEDYLGNNPISALTDIVTRKGVGAGVDAGVGVGALTNTVARIPAVAVTASRWL
jgi:hypothetical protein